MRLSSTNRLKQPFSEDTQFMAFFPQKSQHVYFEEKILDLLMFGGSPATYASLQNSLGVLSSGWGPVIFCYVVQKVEVRTIGHLLLCYHQVLHYLV